MFDLFFKNFREKAALTAAEQQKVESFLTPKKIRKRQYLLQEGDVCKQFAFVVKGALRAFTVDENGSETTLQFALEGWTISDLYSFLTGEPSTCHIEALEDSELLLISIDAHEEMLRSIPAYETYTRLQITGAYLAMQKRLTSILSLSTEERYNNLLTQYPNIVQRVPQHMIASYMGLQPETLSRVRRKMAGPR